MTERKAPDSGGEITDEIFTSVKNEMAQHEELFSMLSGSRKWDGGRVAAGLRSEQLSPSLKRFALSCLANLIDGKDRTERRLKLTGDSKRTHITDAKAEYERIMEIGAWVQSEIDGDVTFRDALYGAEDEFNVSESTAQRALAIFRQRRQRAEETGKWFPVPPVRKR